MFPQPGLFNWTATYRRDSTVVTPYERWVEHHQPPVPPPSPRPPHTLNKTKQVSHISINTESLFDLACGSSKKKEGAPLCQATIWSLQVAWFVSNCGARNGRLEYARELAKHIQVDIFGACGNLTCPRSR